MMRTKSFKILLWLIALFFYTPGTVNAQDRDTAIYKTVIPGPQYGRSSLHNFFWGKHYRTEWTTPIVARKIYLDTAAGGLVPYAAGGGRQTQTLRLRDKEGKEYVLRSIDKSFGKALPPIFQGTFVEKIYNDQVSIAHPYAAFTVSPMANAAGIYHTRPQIVYLPRQTALDSFNTEFAEDLYLFEQRPDGNWEEAANFGNAKNIISTEDLLEKLLAGNRYKVDQRAYIRARLFDIFVGDWGRHEDQWRWAAFEEDSITVYKPIPRDRDQTYTKFDGFLVKMLKSAGGTGHLQTFDATIKDITTYNFPARHLDRLMANEMTLQHWVATAQELQQRLGDNIIEMAVKEMPPEVYSISGPEITANLKTRRDDLVKYATDYYKFLAEEVDVKGSGEAEVFDVSADQNNNVAVNIYTASTTDSGKGRPVYNRIFLPHETKEVRLYGIDGKDQFYVHGDLPIEVRLIGGPDDDTYSGNGMGTHIYDSKNESIGSKNFKLHLSPDTAIHHYKYDAFKYSNKGLSPAVFFHRDDRIFVGLSYKAVGQKWRRQPFANKHSLYARYSINQRAFHVGYDGIINKFLGNWNMLLQADYDWERWTNFFGLGNETVRTVKDRDFYRIRSSGLNAGIGFENKISKSFKILFAPFYNSVDIKTDNDRFLLTRFLQGTNKDVLEKSQFAGAQASLQFKKVDDDLWPAKGTNINATTGYTANLKKSKSFNSYGGVINLYLPLTKQLIFSTQNGGATVKGDPEFYQLPNIGGRTLRGYLRERFWGQTVFHNNNSLQYVFHVKGKLFNGKAGLEAFYDQGKAWYKNERSSAWHTGYGGGFILSPFNKIYISVLYGVSNEKTFRGNLHLDVRKSL